MNGISRVFQAAVLGIAAGILIIVICLGIGRVRESQIRCMKQPGKGDIEYEYRLDGKMKSFLIYKEYYQAGELLGYRVLRAEDLAEAGVKRNGTFTLRIGRNSQTGDTGWDVDFLNRFEGEADFSTDVNSWESLNYGYQGMMESYFLENHSQWEKLKAEQDITLAAWHLKGSGQSELRKIPCQEFMDDQTKETAVGQNEGEILYYLVFSEKSADELRAVYAVCPYARMLFKARNLYIGDASADGELLKALRVFPEMRRTMELETQKEPYTLKLDFENRPLSEISFYERMEKKAILLLCLIENADRIEWTYPLDSTEGRTERHFFCDRERAAELLGVKEVKSFAESEASLQELLTDALPYIYPDCVINVIGLGVGDGRYVSPEGQIYQNLHYFIGRLPGEAYDRVFRVLTDEEKVTAKDVAEAVSQGGASKKLYWIQEGRRTTEKDNRNMQ